MPLIRSTIFRLFCLTVLFGIFSISAVAQPTQDVLDKTVYLPVIRYTQPPVWIGPEGGKVVAFAYNPQNPQIAYAGTWGAGVYKTEDGGGNWKPVNSGLGNLYINSLAVNPQNPSIIYAGTYKSKLFKSSDAGANWYDSSYGIQDQAVVYTIAIDPVVPDRVYIGTRGVSNNGSAPWNGRVYKSWNGGVTWYAVLEYVGGSNQQDWAYSLVVDPKNPNRVFAAIHEHGIFRSTDYGEHWNQMAGGDPDLHGRAIVIDPKNTQKVYYGVWQGDGTYCSVNGGDLWVYCNNGTWNTDIYNLDIDPNTPATVYAATWGKTGVRKSTNSGFLWEPSGLSDEYLYTLRVNPLQPNILFVGTAGNGLFWSQNSGANWVHRQHGLYASNVMGFLSSANTPGLMLAATDGGGVMRSNDSGGNWASFNAGLADRYLHDIVSNPANPNLVYTLSNASGLYRYDLAAGSVWMPIGISFPAFSLQDIQETPSDDPDQQIDAEFWDPAAVFNSINDLSAAAPPLTGLLFAPSNSNIAYLGTTGAGVLKSSDNAASFQPAGLAGMSINSLAVSPIDENKVYAATTVPGSLMKTTNGGQTWTDIAIPGVTITSLAISPADPTTVFAGTSNGVYRIQNDSTIQALGFTGQTISRIAIHPVYPQHIFAAAPDNLYWSSDSGGIWGIAASELAGYLVQSIRFDPLYPDRIYVSTSTRGVVRISIVP